MKLFPIVQIVQGARWGGGIAWENSRHLVTLRLVSPPNDVWETSAEIPDLGGCFCVSSLQLLPLHLQCSRFTSFYLLLYSSVLSYASPLVVSWPFLILCLESTDFFPLVYTTRCHNLSLIHGFFPCPGLPRTPLCNLLHHQEARPSQNLSTETSFLGCK